VQGSAGFAPVFSKIAHDQAKPADQRRVRLWQLFTPPQQDRTGGMMHRVVGRGNDGVGLVRFSTSLHGLQQSQRFVDVLLKLSRHTAMPSLLTL
jgi:hypothetical protein